MKKILFFLGLLAAVGCKAQNPVTINVPTNFTKYISVGKYTTAQLPTAHNCPRCVVFNTDSSNFAFSTGTSWLYFGAGGGGGSFVPRWGTIIDTITKQTDLINLFNKKVNYSDTSSMLNPYLRSALGVKYADTGAMLNHYVLGVAAVKYTDTGSMLAPYFRSALFTKAGIGLGNVLNSQQVVNIGGMDSMAVYAHLAGFPAASVGPTLAYATDSNALYFNNRTAYTKISGGSGGGGGGIDSTLMLSKHQAILTYVPLSNYTQHAIDSLIGFTPYPATNPNGYINGNQTIALTPSGDIKGAASGSTAINPIDTVTGLLTKALPSLSAGNLKYTGTAWQFDNTHYLIGADTASLNGRINLKLNISDTAAMLTPYTRSALVVKYSDTAAMLSPYSRSALVVKYSDTAAMLAPYTRSTAVVKYSDTAAMLSPYARTALVVKYSDTVAMLSVYARSALVVKYSDTTAMLAPYTKSALVVKYSDTAGMLTPYLRSAVAAATYATIANLAAKVNISDTAAMLSPYFRTPTGTTAQYVRGNGTLATTDTTMIPTFSVKVRSLLTALGPIKLSAAGVISADTSAGLSHLVSQNMLINNFDTTRIVYKSPTGLNTIYFVGTDTIVDKGFKNSGNVVFSTNTDSTLSATVDLTTLSANNLISGVIPVARYGTTTIPITAFNVTGTPDGTKALFGDGAWKVPSGGSGTVTLSVQALPAGDSIKCTGCTNAFFPLATHTNAGGMSPVILTRADSIQNFANTRVGDSLMYWNGKDSFYVKGVALQNDGNMIVTSHSNQTEVLWGVKVDTTAGLTHIPTRGELARGYAAINTSTQGTFAFWRNGSYLGASPLSNDTTNSEIKSTVPLNLPGTGSYAWHTVATSSLGSGDQITGTTAAAFNPVNASTTSSGSTSLLVQNLSTSVTGDSAAAGALFVTQQNTADAFTAYKNGGSVTGNGFIEGMTHRFNSINSYSIAYGSTNRSFRGALQLLQLDSVGDLNLKRYAGSGNQMLYVDNSGNVLIQNIPAGLTNPMSGVGDMITGGTSGAPTRLAPGSNGTWLKMVSNNPAWTAITKTDVGLSAVENTALSTWAGSSSLTTLGTVSTGVWNGSGVTVPFGGTGATTLTGYLKGNGTGAFTAVATIPGADVSGSIPGNAANINGTITEAQQTLANNTTGNVTTSRHGYAPTLPNNANVFLNGIGTYTTPTAGANVFNGWQSISSGSSGTIGNANTVFNFTTGQASYSLATPGSPVDGQTFDVFCDIFNGGPITSFVLTTSAGFFGSSSLLTGNGATSTIPMTFTNGDRIHGQYFAGGLLGPIWFIQKF